MNKFILDVAALRQNIFNIKAVLKKDTLFCAMVKANAYGHGIKNVCKNIHDIVDYFGVAVVREGLQIRAVNLAKPILVVGALDKQTAKKAVENYITLTVCNVEDILHLQKICKDLNMVCDVHIKVNSGMNRLGISDINEFDKMLNLLYKNPWVKLKGVFSHFSCSDGDERFTVGQNREFKKFIKRCKMFSNLIFHISSSYCAITRPLYNYDMVRVGLGIYGYSSAKNLELVPLITLKATILALNEVKAGRSVGYGATYKTDCSRLIATVGLGYADGINLKLSGKMQVEINGQKVPVVGRICMDMFMCDVSNVVGVKAGDKVTVFDKTNNASIWANQIGNHEYEVLTNLKTNRVKVFLINK